MSDKKVIVLSNEEISLYKSLNRVVTKDGIDYTNGLKIVNRDSLNLEDEFKIFSKQINAIFSKHNVKADEVKFKFVDGELCYKILNKKGIE